MPTIRRIRIIRHSAVPDTGSYEVRFTDGRESKYFYFDDMAGRRLRPEILTSEQALEQAKAFARAERDGIQRHSSSSRSRRTASLAGFFDFSRVFDGPLR